MDKQKKLLVLEKMDYLDKRYDLEREYKRYVLDFCDMIDLTGACMDSESVDDPVLEPLCNVRDRLLGIAHELLILDAEIGKVRHLIAPDRFESTETSLEILTNKLSLN